MMPVSIEEYLRESYEPDCDFVDGELVDRHAGYHPHGAVIGEILYQLRRFRPDAYGYPILRLRVAEQCIRVADVAVFLERPSEQIPSKPPFICVEVLSEFDSFDELAPKLEDYPRFGVAHIWLIDPAERCGWFYQSRQFSRVTNALRAGAISLDIAQLFAELDG